jgi:HAE1 family hydrophobic/amphiphilic exporter-1
MSIVKSAEGGSILDIVDKAKNKIEEAKGGIIPENVQIEIVSDQAESISNDISDLANNGLQTIIIIIVLLVLFVGWRESLLSAIGVPLTFLISFAVLNWAGYTMNFLTLFALVLSLGILVDNFIVITEGVNRKLRDGREVKQAVIETVREYHLPLTTGVLTTVFAFLPMLLTGGIVGEFIKALPITVTITLLAALFVSLGVLTGLSPKFLTLGKKKKNPDASDKDSSFFLDRVVLPYYTRLLNFFFRKGSHRIWLSIVLIILFAGALMLPIQGILKQDLFPEQDQDYFAVNIEEPVGTPLQQTSKTVSGVERLFLGDGRIESFQSNVGSKYNTFISNSPGGEHQAHILVNLKEDREQPSFEIAEEYRQKLGQKNFFPAEVNVVQLTAGPTSGSPVTINIIGPSLTKLDELGTKIKEELENTEGAVNVETSKKEASGKFSLHIDRAKAQMYGVTTNQVARILRNGIHGTEATVVRQGGEDTDVLVKYDLGDKEVENKVDISTISSLTIATPKGNIPLNAFTSVDMGSQRAFIQHQDGERILQVTSDSVTGVSPVVIADIMKEKIEKMNIPAEYKVTFGGEKEDIQESFRDMMMALLVGVLVIAMLMVLQFKSFRQPLFILLTIPLSIIGIFPGLVAVGQSLSFPAMIGLVGLAGIVVNNAILLIDAINRYRRNGQEKKQAILSASHIRFQPVLLTAATTVGAMIPLTFSNPTWSPIAYSIIFGLSFATVLTLVVIPILYFSWGETTLEEE